MCLKEIAIELLNKYEEAQTALICEYSDHVDSALEKLRIECEEYLRKIESAE